MRPPGVANLGRVGALAIGLPLGVALGRWTWSLLADRSASGPRRRPPERVAAPAPP